MAEDTNTLKSRIKGAARARDFAKVQDLWVDLAASGALKQDLPFFLEVANDVAERGDRELGGQLLLGLLEDMKKEGRNDEAFAVARRVAKIAPRAKGLREELLGHYRRVYESRTGLDGALKRSQLSADGPCDKAVELLDNAFRFAVGDYCSHPSGWGIGKVVEAHPESGEFVIDFARRRGHRIDAVMARTALEKRDPDDLDVLLWTDKDRVRKMAESEPVALLRSALKSTGGKVQARDLREKLAGDVLDKNAWTRFWTAARKMAKDDPWIEIGAAPKSLVTLRQTPMARTDEVAKAVERGGAFSKKLEIARREVLALQKDAKGSPPPAWLAQALAALGKDVKETATKPSDRAIRIEMALFKLEVAATWPQTAADFGFTAAEAVASSGSGPIDPETGEPLAPTTPAAKRTTVLPAVMKKELGTLTAEQLPGILREMSIQEYRRRAVEFVRLTFEKDWGERLRLVVMEPALGTFEAAATALREGGQGPILDAALQKILVAPNKFRDAYAALARARFAGRIGDLVASRPDSEIVAKAIQLLDDVTLEMKSSTEKKEQALFKTTIDALKTFFSEKSHRAIGRVIQEGTEADVRRILQLVRQSPSLTPTVIRATENFVVNRFPELLAQVVAAPKAAADDEAEAVIYTTREGRRRMEKELERILGTEMEEVRLEIGRALEFGDISENSELDAAREKQNRLAERAERVRVELERVQVIDPATVDTSEVRIGTRVSVKVVETGKVESFSILGPWDVDEAHGVISHLSPTGRGLLGHGTGDVATIQLPDGNRARFEILSIERAVPQVPQESR